MTVITGFLGSGKSTLIRRILTEDHGMRLVVVENEFGSNAAVEEAIVTQGVGPDALEQFIELPNGCICCAAQDELTDALARLLRTPGLKVDHILVEASGLADPGPVAASFWVDDDLETGLKLNGVITIADAANVERYLQDEDGRSEKAIITQKQLAVSDLVLLNKADLISTSHQGSYSAGLKQLQRVIRSAGCTCSLIPTTRCDVPLASLLNINAYDTTTSERDLGSGVPSKLLGHAHPGRLSVGSLSFTMEAFTFDSALLDRALGGLLWEDLKDDGSTARGSTMEIWRMKALVAVEGERHKRIYQSVDSLFDHSPSSVELQRDRNFTSRFIFIGKHLEEGKLKSCLGRAKAEKWKR